MKLEIFKLDSKATLPTRNHPSDAGADLYALEEVFIRQGDTCLIKTGIAIRIPENFVGLIKERSSVGKKGLKTAGGVIDSLYSGDVSILLMNISNRDDCNKDGRGYLVKAGDRVAQILIIPVSTPIIEETRALWSSDRGSKGFGSSNR